MTFSVVRVNDRVRKIIGTVWASDEAGAWATVNSLLNATPADSFKIERNEEREIPLRVRELGPQH